MEYGKPCAIVFSDNELLSFERVVFGLGLIDKDRGTILDYVSALATPLGLMALGASFQMGEAVKRYKPTVVATFLKLIGFCAIWIPVAISLGYTHDKLVAVLIMTGSPTTVSSFVMAKSMGYNGTVSASIVMLTTILSAFTLTVWLYILRSMGLI